MSARNTYKRPMSGWWRTNPFFMKYMIREGTSVFFAIYAFILLAGLIALSRGETAYVGWLGFLSHPLVVVLHIAVLAAALYHTYTWFKVSPKAAPPVYVKGERLPDAIIIGSQYIGLVVASVVVVAGFAWL